jgi:thymidylate synthase
MSKSGSGFGIPVLVVEGATIAEAYEKALVALYQSGMRFKTQYDKEDDPQSIDSTMNITIHNPLLDPMIHKAFPGGIADLREYVMELQGAKDHWVKCLDDPEDKRWEYTYHGRFKKYGLIKSTSGEQSMFCPGTSDYVDQIESVIQKICDQPFTRQAQMITWIPSLDITCFDPPCLQSMWYRISEDTEPDSETFGTYFLNCNVRIRSNDAWGANFMNMFGLTMFNHDVIAAEIRRRTGRKVVLDRLNWQADSYHIYGKDIQQAKDRLFSKIESGQSFLTRVLNFWDESIQEMYHEATQEILEKIQRYDLGHQK